MATVPAFISVAARIMRTAISARLQAMIVEKTGALFLLLLSLGCVAVVVGLLSLVVFSADFSFMVDRRAVRCDKDDDDVKGTKAIVVLVAIIMIVIARRRHSTAEARRCLWKVMVVMVMVMVVVLTSQRSLSL